MQAVRLKQVDQDYRNHLQAYLGFVVKAEKKSGKYKTKPVYDKFEKFYNYEEAVKKAKQDESKEQSRFSGVGKFFKKGG